MEVLRAVLEEKLTSILESGGGLTATSGVVGPSAAQDFSLSQPSANQNLQLKTAARARALHHAGPKISPDSGNGPLGLATWFDP